MTTAHQLGEIINLLHTAAKERKALMSKLDEVNSKLGMVNASLDALEAEVKAVVDAASKNDPTVAAAADAALVGMDAVSARVTAVHDALKAAVPAA